MRKSTSVTVTAGRGEWIADITAEIIQASQEDMVLQGICLYPILDRHGWENLDHWHRSGLWDLHSDPQGNLVRIMDKSDAKSLVEAQWKLAKTLLLSNLSAPSRSAYLLSKTLGDTMSTIIVFSHLRWNFVFQRPQQLMTRLAQRYRIVFLEEPVFHDGKAHYVHYEVAPNVRVVQPHTPISSPGFHDGQLSTLNSLLPDLIDELNIEDYIAWLYTPMALPLINQLRPKAIVYDCMDELTGFLQAPRQLVQREHALLEAANVVFTGGVSLYNARRGKHPAVHCLPSSVDANHFSRAIERDIAYSAQQDLGGPRLGFFGVINERIDLGLLGALADSHPEWQIVMVGPVVKIPESWLPQRPNIHYFGHQPYEQLPHFLAGWDACLLPFALNDATRYISPTKTLEYMAAELPIISTPIKDVEEPYGHLVHIAADAEAFVTACEAALNESPDRRQDRLTGYHEILGSTSWDRTADIIAGHLEAACQQGLNETARLMLKGYRPSRVARPCRIISTA